MNTALLHRCSYTSEYNAKMRFSCIWDQDFQGVNPCLICMKICGTEGRWVNSLAPGGFHWKFKWVTFKLNLVIDGWGISCDFTLVWLSQDLTDDKSTLALIMAWCRQATSHYLSQRWLRSTSPYGVTRPQWVKRATIKTMKLTSLQTVTMIHHEKYPIGMSKMACSVSQCTFNPLRAKFFRVNLNMYLHFMSFLLIDMTKALKILPQIR